VNLHDQNSDKIDSTYFIANILGLVDCIDLGASKVKMRPSGNGFDIESLAIDESKTRGLKVFRLKDRPTKVIINEALKEYLVNAKILAGVQIFPTENYAD
jgi:hypothetical protein